MTNIRERTYRCNLEKVADDVKMPTPAGHVVAETTSASGGADLVIFFASDESTHITGAEIVIDGAASLIRG